MKKQKMRLSLRSLQKPKIINGTKKDVAAQLRDLAEERGKLTENLRELNQRVTNTQQLQNAGMLAHYALLALLLGSLIKGVHKKYMENQLEKLGKSEMGFTEKMENIIALEQNSKAIMELNKKMGPLEAAQKALLEPELREAESMRDVIAKKLGLSDEELNALTKTFTTHHEKMSESKDTSILPIVSPLQEVVLAISKDTNKSSKHSLG